MALQYTRARFQSSPELKVNILTGLITLAFVVILAKVFYLQILNYPQYRNLSENNSLRLIPQRAARGIITDRTGLVLAANVPTYSLFLVPADIRSTESTLSLLSRILEEPLDSLETLVENRRRTRKFEPIRLASHLGEELVAEIEENRVRLPGVYLQMEPERYYPQNELASHILGYIGEISEPELKRLKPSGYMSGSWIGKKGIERSYDRILCGENGGVQVEVDASGIQRRVLAFKKPVRGKTLRLTIDWKIQKLAEEMMEGLIGSIVVANPRTGEILAMVSQPNFDPNEFVSGISYKAWNKLIKDEAKPLQNRAVQGTYPPGSIFKVITTLAALEDKAIDLGKVFLCRGIFWYKTWPYRCWRTSGHSWMNLERAIIESCDIFFYQMGLQVRVDKIYRVARRLGLGGRTQIDLPGEVLGLVPNPRWKESTQHMPWFPGNTIQMSIGQGYVLTTPLQMLDVTSGIAMNGQIFKPHFLRQVVDPETNRVVLEQQPQILSEAELNQTDLDFLKGAMEKVITGAYGTGKKARIPGVRVAGKTGTSENPHGENHAWFMSYAPAENPSVAVIVMVENGGEGGIVAAPMAKRLMEAALGMEVTPWQVPTPGASAQGAPSAPVSTTQPTPAVPPAASPRGELRGAPPNVGTKAAAATPTAAVSPRGGALSGVTP